EDPMEAPKHIANPPEPNATVTTIVLGRLLLHAITLPLHDLAPDPVAYGRRFGVFPIHPWEGPVLDSRWTPIIRAGSAEFDNLKDDFYRGTLNVPAFWTRP